MIHHSTRGQPQTPQDRMFHIHEIPQQQNCGGRDGEAGLRVTATENSTPSGSQTDCTREHVKNHSTAIFHGKAECYINAVSAVLLKENTGPDPQRLLLQKSHKVQKGDYQTESRCGSVSQSSQHRGSEAGCRKLEFQSTLQDMRFQATLATSTFPCFYCHKTAKKTILKSDALSSRIPRRDLIDSGTFI